MSDDEFDGVDAWGFLDLRALLYDPLGIVRRRWRWMLLAALAVALIAGVQIYRMRPSYLARATVIVASQEIPESFVRSTVREDPFRRVNAMVGEILAREKLSDLIEKHGLYPEMQSAPMSEIAAQMRSSIEVSAERGLGTPTRQETAQLFRVEFEYRDRQIAAAVANDLADLFAEAGVRLRMQQASLTTEFLRRELARAERELREQDRKVTEFQKRYRGELPADLEPNLRELERLQAQQQSLSLQIAQAESRRDSLVNTQDSPDARLLALRGELAQQLAVHTERHPDVVALRQQIAKLEEEKRRSRDSHATHSTLLATSSHTIDELRRQHALAGARIRGLEDRVAMSPERAEELAALEGKQSVLKDTYIEFLNKVKEAELAQSLELAQQGGRISVLERAAPPTQPKRTRAASVAIGVLASLGAAVAMGMLLELVNPVLLTGAETRSIEGVPILGSVPRMV